MDRLPPLLSRYVRRPPAWLQDGSWKRWLAISLVIICVAGLLLKLVLSGAVVRLLVGAVEGVRDMGFWSSVPILILCEAAAFLVLLPISPLHVGVGFLFGPYTGALIAWSAYSIGCVPPFLLARVPLLAERLKVLRRRAEVLDGVFCAVEAEPFKLIVCLRLSPVLPSPLNSYLLGLTNVKLSAYLAATMVGGAPNVCAHVYIGTMLESLADIAAGRVKRSPLSWALLLTGCFATVAVLVYVSRAATRRVNAANNKMRVSTTEAKGEGLGTASKPPRRGRPSTPEVAAETEMVSPCAIMSPSEAV